MKKPRFPLYITLVFILILLQLTVYAVDNSDEVTGGGTPTSVDSLPLITDYEKTTSNDTNKTTGGVRLDDRINIVELDGTPPSAAPSFTDVFPNDYYAPAVAWAVEKGVTNGTSSTTFSPNADCNRAQMVTFLWRAAGSPAPESGDASKFTDVKSSDYFAQAVAWAVENGVTNGTSDAAFSPYSPVTRAQAVTFLWRAQGRPAAAAGESYADVEAGGFYADAVRWAAAKNVTKGTGESTFSPSTTVNRAMSVTFLYRAYGVT